MKNFINEFKKFAMKGNVLDMAVGVIIGGAFGKIVTSLVDDIIMPIIGAITGGVKFAGLAIKIGSAEIAYGNFIQNIVDFLIVALCIFVMIKAINKTAEKMKKEEEAKPEEPKGPTQEELLAEIRDLLKENK
ncbi:MAG: large-conductance mechanosensitive channel protein MscL [Eubacteriales bacterium]|nr:large-conductance mechanosensitive channel protein MscL [Eubacteriales bacterium]